jgi:hypothetical protein
MFDRPAFQACRLTNGRCLHPAGFAATRVLVSRAVFTLRGRERANVSFRASGLSVSAGCYSHPGRGMGVEFTAMEHEARARLDRLLRKLIADPKIPHLNEQLALRK